MTPVPIERLFETVRTKSLISTLLYLPIGLILILFRIIIGLQAFLFACILPTGSLRRNVLKAHWQLLGLSVDVDGEKNRNPKVKVLVSNHISKVDHLSISYAQSCVIPGVWDLPKWLEWALGIKDLGAKQGREILIRNTKQYCLSSKVPILTHPEGATTNGKEGLLKFGTWPFSLDQPIQPITIKRVGSQQIALTVIGSRWWTDLLWLFYQPTTKFKIRILPAVEKGTDESVEHFSSRVQTAMAADLQIVATNYTCHDKLEYVKKILFKPKTSVNQIDRWSLQVKEVLPAVPLDIIKKDIAKTRSVDTTIMHLLEGTIAYTPEQLPSEAAPSTSQSPPRSPPVSETAAKTFQKTSKERVLSLQERKNSLIQSARKRYIEKHGLNLTP